MNFPHFFLYLFSCQKVRENSNLIASITISYILCALETNGSNYEAGVSNNEITRHKLRALIILHCSTLELMKEKFLRTSLTFFFVQRRRTALRRFFFADWKAESEGGNNQVNESSSRSISSYTLEAFTSEFMTDFHFRKALDFFSIRWSHGSSKQLLVLQQQHSV